MVPYFAGRVFPMLRLDDSLGVVGSGGHKVGGCHESAGAIGGAVDRLSSQTNQAKDLEILLLRRQLAMLERKLEEPVRLSRTEKMTLAVLAVRLKTRMGQTARQLGRVIRVVQPETVLKWPRGWCVVNGHTTSRGGKAGHALGGVWG
jgi:hypothetical protein